MRQLVLGRSVVLDVLPGRGLSTVAHLEPAFLIVFRGRFHDHVEAGHITVANQRELFLELVVDVHVAVVG